MVKNFANRSICGDDVDRSLQLTFVGHPVVAKYMVTYDFEMMIDKELCACVAVTVRGKSERRC